MRMYPNTSIHSFLYKASLIPASILLNYRQKQYIHWLLSLLNSHLIKEILPISTRKRDRGCQPGEILENTLLWTENT